MQNNEMSERRAQGCPPRNREKTITLFLSLWTEMLQQILPHFYTFMNTQGCTFGTPTYVHSADLYNHV